MKILLVEDSKALANVIKSEITSKLSYCVDLAYNFNDAKNIIETQKDEYFLSILDYHLPDSSDGEIIDFALSKNMSVIVFTGNFNEKVRENIWSKNVIDYVLKEDIRSIDYIISLIRRIHQNTKIKVLIADSNKSSKAATYRLLKTHKYQIYEAENGKKALDVLNANPDIKMVITEFKMPEMDGFTLLRNIRNKYAKDQLAVIGISSNDDNMVSAQFIKKGANDFITKPFLSEEFYCRINLNMEILQYIQKIKDAANTDFLTSLYNRRYFFDAGNHKFDSSKNSANSLSAAMIDIDFFKKINDKYGHDAGDIVLKKVSKIIKDSFTETDIVARLGGEEFCVLTSSVENNMITDKFDALRKEIENTKIELPDKTINITISTGISNKTTGSLDDMLKEADEMLYKAKESGRNKVEVFNDKQEQETASKMQPEHYYTLISLASSFIVEHKNGWNNEVWSEFIDGLKEAGFDITSQKQTILRLSVEKMFDIHKYALPVKVVLIIFERMARYIQSAECSCDKLDSSPFLAEIKAKGLTLPKDLTDYLCDVFVFIKNLYIYL
ncbi:response regulator/GGDEF domain-containing protein [Candidatus Magnetoovum chiemensis]|nr:response regulator/GGDEF domain-containing protein [Candidatus Magnetoovum chiemensis]